MSDTAEDIALRLRSHETEGVTASDRYHLRNEAAAEIDRLRKKLEAWEERWKALRWCHSGCKEDAPNASAGPAVGFGGTDPFGLGW